jgi:hypothetical protein
MIGSQGRQLLLGPCKLLRARERLGCELMAPLVIIVDALDKCKVAAEVEFVLQLIFLNVGLGTGPSAILVAKFFVRR